MKPVHSIFLAMTFAACQSPLENPPEVKGSADLSATLGVTTTVPSGELAREMGLGFQVRQQGRVVASVADDSAASRAGIRVGDVLVQLGAVTLYSQDDIDDFLSVQEPGAEVRATVVQNGTREREELGITLGTGAARPAGTIRWQYASLAQLPAALEQARAEKKKVLVGLSGAET